MGLFKKSQTSDDEPISLADAGNAWWAERDELEKVFVPKKRTIVDDLSNPPSTPVSEFSEKYSSESLFNWASSPEPDDPTFGGRGTSLDPYEVLGLQPGATLSEVVSAHRSLAKRYHPDQHHGADDTDRATAANRMTMINAAYQELRSRLMTHRHTV